METARRDEVEELGFGWDLSHQDEARVTALVSRGLGAVSVPIFHHRFESRLVSSGHFRSRPARQFGGVPVWPAGYLAATARVAELRHGLAAALADPALLAFASETYDFAGVRRIVDVGGGHGTLLAAILEAHPKRVEFA